MADPKDKSQQENKQANTPPNPNPQHPSNQQATRQNPDSQENQRTGTERERVAPRTPGTITKPMRAGRRALNFFFL